MTFSDDQIIPMTYRQTGEQSKRVASPKDIEKGDYLIHTEGLTKREHFAAMAMQGIISHCYNAHPDVFIAERAVLMADALIEELNKPDPPK